MPGVSEAMDERDSHGIDACCANLFRDLDDRGFVDGLQYFAGWADALRHLETPVPGYEGLGHLHEEVVGVVAPLRADFEYVPEARRRYKGHSCAAALDDRVGDQRRAVNDLSNVSGFCVVVREDLAQAFEHAL